MNAVSRQATDTAREIVRLGENHRERIVDEFGQTAGDGLRVLEQLYTRPIISVNKVEAIIGKTYAAANSLAKRFEKAEILFEITGHKRNRLFEYSPYVNLFQSI